MGKRISCYGSNVLIQPLSKENKTYRGRVMAKGTTGAIQLKIDDIVYYNEEDVLISLAINSVDLHCCAHYRICFYEVDDGHTKNETKPVKNNDTSFDPEYWNGVSL